MSDFTAVYMSKKSHIVTVMNNYNICYSSLDSGRKLKVSQMSLYKLDTFLIYLHNDKL